MTSPTPLDRTPFGTFTFSHEGMAIHNPVFSSCGRFSVSPQTYGFEVADTGGGCTAWRREFVLDGEPVYMLLTDLNDATHVFEAGPIRMGVYPEDASWSVSWAQAEGSLDDTPPTDFYVDGTPPLARAPSQGAAP